MSGVDSLRHTARRPGPLPAPAREAVPRGVLAPGEPSCHRSHTSGLGVGLAVPPKERGPSFLCRTMRKGAGGGTEHNGHSQATWWPQNCSWAVAASSQGPLGTTPPSEPKTPKSALPLSEAQLLGLKSDGDLCKDGLRRTQPSRGMRVSGRRLPAGVLPSTGSTGEGSGRGGRFRRDAGVWAASPAALPRPEPGQPSPPSQGPRPPAGLAPPASPSGESPPRHPGAGLLLGFRGPGWARGLENPNHIHERKTQEHASVSRSQLSQVEK